MRSLTRIGLAFLFFALLGSIGLAQSGVISTVAGNGVWGYNGDGGPATSALLNNPASIAVDTAGNLFIADTANFRVRKVTPGGIISTVAGNGTEGSSGDGGPATSAQLNAPGGVAVDKAGNLFIADTACVRKVTPGGVISTVAGSLFFWGFSGDGGPATSAQLYNPASIAVDSAGNLFIADTSNKRVRKVDASTGIITTVAGNGLSGTEGFGGDGGPAISAQLNGPMGIAVDTAGNLFIADTGNNRVRKVDASTGIIATVAGNGTSGFSGDGGPATSAELHFPERIALDIAGNLFIADTDNQRIREVTLGGVISTVAGNGTSGFSGDGGPAISAELKSPEGVAVDTAGNPFIADTSNQRVREVTGLGNVPNPVPIITSLSPTSVTAGGAAFTLTVNGTNFLSNSTVQWNGSNRTTTFVSRAQLTASVSAGDIAAIGSASITVFNPAPGGGISNSQVFDILATSTFFPQVAVGGGYSTVFTVTNTGSTSASGSLTLTDQQGNPFPVNGTLTDSSGTTQPALPGYSFSLTVPSGGTIFLSATGLTTSSPVTAGWGQLDSVGGSLSAVATYEYVVGSILQTMVGVLQSQPLQYATIPVDNDTSQSKQTVYAIANPSGQTIAIKLALVDQDGTVVDDTVTVTLGPGQQVATYLWQSLGRTNFKGSLVLRGQSGATFVAVALVYKLGVLTAIPLISGKAPGVPNYSNGIK